MQQHGVALPGAWQHCPYIPAGWARTPRRKRREWAAAPPSPRAGTARSACCRSCSCCRPGSTARGRPRSCYSSSPSLRTGSTAGSAGQGGRSMCSAGAAMGGATSKQPLHAAVPATACGSASQAPHPGACAAVIPGADGLGPRHVAVRLALPEVLVVVVAGGAAGAARVRVAGVEAGHGGAAAGAPALRLHAGAGGPDERCQQRHVCGSKRLAYGLAIVCSTCTQLAGAASSGSSSSLTSRLPALQALAL